MGVAIIEIYGNVDSREVVKKSTGEIFNFHNQNAYLHGQNAPYPLPFTMSFKEAKDALTPGLYLFSGTAFKIEDGKPHTTRFLEKECFVPLAEAMRELQTKSATYKSPAAA